MKLIILPLLFVALTWIALIYALEKTKKYGPIRPRSKYSPFSRKVAHTVSLVHLADNRLMWVKARAEGSQSPARPSALTLLATAEEKLTLAKGFLANDELEAANALLAEVLALIDQSEDKLDNGRF